MSEQDELAGKLGFADTSQARLACVLLLDTSSSMEGEPIAKLNEGLRDFRDTLFADTLASMRVEVAVVTFDDDVKVVQDFVTADAFEPVELTAQGYTYMGTAIETALDMIEARKQAYRASGMFYYRPWVFMITDGEPQGEDEGIIERAGSRIKERELGRGVSFYAVGVEKANMDLLRRISVRQPVKLAGLDFRGMFQWLSNSMKLIGRSKPDEQVALPQLDWTQA